MTSPTVAVEIEPMQQRDLDEAVEVSARAFGFGFDAERPRDQWRARLEHVLFTDPHGCFVARADGRLVGLAEAMRRGRLWTLSLLTVDPDAQSRGVGRALTRAALGYRQADDAGLIVGSNDPRALRLYGRCGFALEPTFQAQGSVDPARLSAPDARITELTNGDLRSLDGITVAVRGASYAREWAATIDWGARIYALADRGFVVVKPGHVVWALAAVDVPAAQALLWHGLRVVGTADTAPVRWITGMQQWAVEVVVAAGLRPHPYGALCVAGHPGTLHPYLPSGPYA